MQRYFGQTVRVKETIFSLRDDSAIMNPKLAVEMETIAHLWNGQILIVRETNMSLYFSHALVQRIQHILCPEIISRVRVLTIWSPDLSFKDYPMLYAAKIFHADYTKQFKNPMNLLYFLEEPRAKPITVINCFYWNTSVTQLIDLISQSFSSALIVSAFRLIIAFERKIVQGFEVRVKEFRVENRNTNEILQLKYVTEKEVINMCGEWINYETCRKRHVLVQRSQL
ncbi:hypothetical protein Ddc_16720 [Ditylenchus destructor]|nr:hypothetical protein Ddc_16720 [Ditylenchus destructor]